MCLDSITRRYKKKRTGIGYKIMTKKGRRFYGQCYTEIDDGYMLNKVYNSTANPIHNGYNNYESGYHIYGNKEEAIAWYGKFGMLSDIIVKVKYYGGYIKGMEGAREVIVAKKIKILGEV